MRAEGESTDGVFGSALAQEVDMNAARYVRLVVWSFFGIRRSEAASEELEGVRPIPLILTAITLAIGFAGFLILLASFAAEALH